MAIEERHRRKQTPCGEFLMVGAKELWRKRENRCPSCRRRRRGLVPALARSTSLFMLVFGVVSLTVFPLVDSFSTKPGAVRASSYLLASDKPSNFMDVVAEVLPPGPSSKKAQDLSRASKEDSSLPVVSTEEYTESMKMSLEKREALVNNDQQEREKYIVLGLLWAIAAISALDRVAMSVAIIPMSQELDLSNTLKGSISSLFSVGYGIGILPAGLILSTLSPRLVMAFGVAVWSIATIATPGSAELVAFGAVAPLFLVRALVGAGESFVIPTVQRLLAVWTQPDQRSLAFAFIFSGFQAGTIGAYLLSPSVMDALGGWRGLFYAYGAVGLVMLLPWLVLAKDGPTVESATLSAAAEIDKNKNNKPALSEVSETKTTATTTRSLKEALLSYKEAPWMDFLRSKGCWGILLAHAAKNYGLYNNLAWTPTFYAQQYGVGVKESAFLSVLPSVAGAAGGFVAGAAADSILRNTENVSVETTTQVRKVFQAIGLFGPAFALGFLALYTPEDPVVAQFALTAAVGLQSFNSAGFEAGLQDKTGPKWAGMLYSVTSLPAVMLGTFGVWFTGVVLDSTQNDWGLVFTMIASINVMGGLAFLSLFDSKREFD